MWFPAQKQKFPSGLAGTLVFPQSSIPSPADPRQERDEFHFFYCTLQGGLLQKGTEEHAEARRQKSIHLG